MIVAVYASMQSTLNVLVSLINYSDHSLATRSPQMTLIA